MYKLHCNGLIQLLNLFIKSDMFNVCNTITDEYVIIRLEENSLSSMSTPKTCKNKVLQLVIQATDTYTLGGKG